jgi:YihY family inner membrane protein
LIEVGMHPFNEPRRYLLEHPLRFCREVVRGFARNQGLVMAGAVAYYALLSLIPLLILSVLALSSFIEPDELLAVLGHSLEWLVPSQSQALLADVAVFMDNGITLGAVLVVTMIFFSSLAFSILEKAMGVIFSHRRERVQRHFMVSAMLPYLFVMMLGVGLLAITAASIVLQSIAQESVYFLGREWPLRGFSGSLLYLAGMGGEVSVLVVFYLVLPVGRTRLSHAILGALTVAAIWEAVRHALVWYFAAVSRASVVYGSLTTAVVALFSMEIAATLLLLGAQVIAQYELLKEQLHRGSGDPSA